MQIEIKKIDELIPAPYNLRKISNKDYERLKHSIKEFGRVSTLTEAKKEAYKVIFNAPKGTR